MSSKDQSFPRSFGRLWQPQRGLFWLMLTFNALSSALAWWLHLTQPSGALLVVVTLLAVTNTLIGWWLLVILWREGAGTTSGETPHV